MPEKMIDAEELQQLVSRRLQTAGISEVHAHIVSDVLVHADLRGVHSHGVLRTEHYCKRFEAGGIKRDPKFSVDKKSHAALLFNGDHGMGHVIAKEAMEVGVQGAKEHGICAVGVQNSNHCGALSYYGQQAANAGFIAIAMTHTDKYVVPFGGSSAFFGTNPIAFGIPALHHDPIILDMATSQAAFGKVLQAREVGQQIPNDWGVNAQGVPVTDPDEVVAMLPFGGPKGYGLAMMVDIFSGLLTGTAFGPHISAMYGDYEKNRELGHFFIVIDPGIFVEKERFLTKVDEMIDELHETPPAEGFSRVLVPGEPEQLLTKKREAEGIPVTSSVLDFLQEAK